MKLSVIFEDGTIVRDGVAVIGLPLVYDPNWKALQWNGDRGWIETKKGDDIRITDADLEPWLVAHQNAINPPPPVKTKEELDAELRLTIQAFTRDRILAALKDDYTQVNMTALGARLTRLEALGQISEADKAILNTLEAAQAWVMQTLSKGREMALALDTGYADEAKWPPLPPGVKELVAAL